MFLLVGVAALWTVFFALLSSPPLAANLISVAGYKEGSSLALSDTFDDERLVPDENLTDVCTCNCHERVWNKHSLREEGLVLAKVLLLNSWRVVLEL